LKNLIIRTLTGLAVVGVVLGSILYNEYTFAFLFALILILGLHEFYQLFKNSLVTPHRLAGYVLGLAVFGVLLAIAASILEPVWLLAVPVLLLVVFGAELSRAKEYPAGNIAITVFGALYLALPLGLAGFLVFPEEIGITEYTPHILVALLSFIWIYDSGAYLFGVNFGRHRLFERISPKNIVGGCSGRSCVYNGCFAWRMVFHSRNSLEALVGYQYTGSYICHVRRFERVDAEKGFRSKRQRKYSSGTWWNIRPLRLVAFCYTGGGFLPKNRIKLVYLCIIRIFREYCLPETRLRINLAAYEENFWLNWISARAFVLPTFFY
jgi:phosphatidate cytidylyltransferase